ncbi:MAG TPA: hypothetical protein DCR57_03235, partial [Pasteurella multocida]|nr:hypothetical protein [Pasteurella multocida]
AVYTLDPRPKGRGVTARLDNLNDLYKEKSEKFYEIINAWEKEEMSKECRWVIKYGSRNVAKN